MQHELTPEDIDEIITNALEEKSRRREVKRSKKKPADKSPKQVVQGTRKSGASNKQKTCPSCGNGVSKRKADGTCPKCGTKLFLADGEYYTISQPQERLFLYNWSQFMERFQGYDFDKVEDVKQFMPSSDEISMIYLKNEAWAANKLLSLCDRDFEWAKTVIDIYHEETPRSNIRALSLYYIVSNPAIKVLIDRAKKRLAAKVVQEAIEQMNTQAYLDRLEKSGKIFQESDDMLNLEDE